MSQPTPPPFTPARPAGQPAPPTSGATGQPAPPSADQATYQNNPFFIAIEGIKALFRYAKPVAIALIVISVFGFIFNAYSNTANIFNTDTTQEPTTQPAINEETTAFAIDSPESMGAIVGIIGLVLIVGMIVSVVVLLIGAVVNGLRDVAAAAAVNQQTITLKEAFSTLFRRFPGYLWLLVIVAVKTLLWSLLFIIPGIIMAVRYSLAGVAFFSQNMKAAEAVRYSTQITKNGWTTLFASNIVFNFVTLNTITILVQSSVYAVLFRQYHQLEVANIAKPSPHWLSVVATVLLFTFLGVAILLLFAFIGFAAIAGLADAA